MRISIHDVIADHKQPHSNLHSKHHTLSIHLLNKRIIEAFRLELLLRIPVYCCEIAFPWRRNLLFHQFARKKFAPFNFFSKCFAFIISLEIKHLSRSLLLCLILINDMKLFVVLYIYLCFCTLIISEG